MRWLRLLAFNALVLLAGIVVLELVFGSWIVDNRIRNLNLVVDRLYVHDVSSLYDNGGEPIVYRRDAYGLRGKYESPDAIDILTIGGSTTDQKYLSEGATWQDVMSARFARDGRSVSVVNAGVDGHTTRGHLRSFEWWFPNIPGLHPRFVLFFVGVNDSHLQAQREYDRMLEDEEPTWADELRERSGLYYAFRTLRGIWRAERTKLGHRKVGFEGLRWVSEPRRDRHEERTAAQRFFYAQRLRELARRTRALGAEPIFVTQLQRSWKPSGDSVVGVAGGEMGNGVDLSIRAGLFNRTTMEVCQQERAICIDLASDLRDAFEDSDFYDFVHTNPSGAEKIGNYLYEQLRDVVAQPGGSGGNASLR